MPLFRIQFRTDTTENWESCNPILLKGEMGLEITPDGDKLFKLGDGVMNAAGEVTGTAWLDLPYASGPRGPKGNDGEPGETGAPPAHEWNGTALRFSNPDGSWGQAVNLKGAKGDPGDMPSIPVASTQTAGIVKVGSNLIVDATGLISVNADGVVSEVRSEIPLASQVVPSGIESSGAVGESNNFARADHVHSISTALLANEVRRICNITYSRPHLFTSNRTSLTIPAGTYAYINGQAVSSLTDTELHLADLGTLDSLKGKDMYIHARIGDSGMVFYLSLNKVEDGAVCIGGFHGECADVGTISGHPLSGWLAGDILPASHWDLAHCPVSDPEGMVFSQNYWCWYDIYLQSGTLANTKSVFNATTTRRRTQSGHELDMLYVKKRLLTSHEFTDMSLGSNQKTAISGAKEYANTGGHVDTAGRRMTSFLGCEDANGLVWQWLCDLAYMNHSTRPSADTTTNMGGEWDTNALLAGGSWHDSVSCGSAARNAASSRLAVHAVVGGRGRAEHKQRV